MNLKKTIALLTAFAAVATGVNAASLVLSQNSSHSVGNGGAFTASNVLGGDITTSDYSSLAMDGAGFLTFCLEKDEYFNPGGRYNYALSFGSKDGGVNVTTTPGYDGISNATAWLYSEFAKGTLTAGGFNYSKGWKGDLQQAIWFLEGELTALSAKTANLLVTAAKAQSGANWNADSNGSYGVQAINLRYRNANGGDAGVAQDQLYYHGVPDGGMTITMLGLALLGLGLVRRRLV